LPIESAVVVFCAELIITVVLDDTDAAVTMVEELEAVGAVVVTITTVCDVVLVDVNVVCVKLDVVVEIVVDVAIVVDVT